MRPFRKQRRPGNRGQTVGEAAHVDLVKRSGCICCIAQGFMPEDGAPMVEAHHLLSGGIRIGHGSTIGICPWHHRGRLVVEAWSFAEHRLRLGPSLAEGSGPFHAHFGDDARLLELQAERLAA